MAVWGITGNPLKKLGTGKTLTAIYLIVLMSKRLNLKIYSNIHLYGIKYTPINHPREIIGLENAIVFLDDIYRFLGGRDSSVRKLCNIVAGESRKARIEVIYTSSALTDMVKKTLRRHTDYFVIPSFDKATNTLKIEIQNPLGMSERLLPPALPASITTRLFKYYNTRERVPIVTDF
jgi:hypothetical protein